MVNLILLSSANSNRTLYSPGSAYRTGIYTKASLKLDNMKRQAGTETWSDEINCQTFAHVMIEHVLHLPYPLGISTSYPPSTVQIYNHLPPIPPVEYFRRY